METQDKTNKGFSQPKSGQQQDIPNRQGQDKNDRTKEMSPNKRPSEVELPIRDRPTHPEQPSRERQDNDRTQRTDRKDRPGQNEPRTR